MLSNGYPILRLTRAERHIDHTQHRACQRGTAVDDNGHELLTGAR